MERYRKSVFYCTLILILLSLIVTFQEGPTLPVMEQFSYYSIRAFLILSLIVALPIIKRNPFSQRVNIFISVIFSIYCIHGQYYNPWYIFCFIQIKYALAFLYPLKRKYFITMTLVSSAAFTSMVVWRFETFARWAASPILPDITLSILCTLSVAIMANYFFTADRTYREETIRRFGLIGVQSAAIIHDIKGLVAAPKIYAEVIREKINKNPQADPELKEMAKNLEQSLERFSSILIELNRMTSLHIREKEVFVISEVLEEVQQALSLNRRNIKLVLLQDRPLFTEKALFKSIIFNIVLNSVQAFQRARTSDPVIKFTINADGSLSITDNGGGFETTLLQRLEDEQYSQSSVSGTGLGTFLISDGMKSLGGQAEFRNHQDGAQVNLNFPKKIFSKIPVEVRA